MTFNSLKVKKRLIGFALVMFLIQGLIHFSGNDYIYKAIRYNFSEIDDYKIFDNRVIEASSGPVRLPSRPTTDWDLKFERLDESLVETQTVAFLLIESDTVRLEHYWDGYTDSSVSNSFSMAKSYVSTLIGTSLKRGEISSLDDPVGAYVEHFNNGKLNNVSIRDVLKMSSGTDWYESYANPFSITTKAYYGDDLEEVLSVMEYEEASNQRFKYLSGDTQILAFVLEAATGKTLSELLENRLWEPLGMEQQASWSLDKDGGHEKAYCCVNSNARDFAKLGLLYLNKGTYNGEEILSADYVRLATTPAQYENGDCAYYGYQWWLLPAHEGVFYARGLHGQYIIVVPSKKIVIVRLGHQRKEKSDGIHPDEVYDFVDMVLE
jgi:CubicO group peptidase (beta-lactamase class C family)